LNGKRDNFVRDDLTQAASLISNFKKEAKQIIEQVLNVVNAWDTYATAAEVGDDFATTIKQNLRTTL
jgi:hypothetical protein